MGTRAQLSAESAVAAMAGVIAQLREELEFVLGGGTGRLDAQQCHVLRAALVEASELLSLIESSPSTPPGPPSEAAPERSRSIRVLIADDENDFAKMLEELLEAEDELAVVGRARNGEEAFALTKALSPDVVLMDLNMPVLDGIEATRRISESGLSAGVVILTGLDIAGDSERAREAGAVGYVRKMRISEDLMSAILAAVPAR
jgi:CheY-like chemotaxis protein